MLDLLKNLFGILPAALVPAATPAYQTLARQWLILHAGPNPSTDYYISPRAEASGLPASYRNIDSDTPQTDDLAPGTFVVIVRYLTPNWAKALTEKQANLAGVVYFMDDDLLDATSWQALPKPYKKKLRRYCQAQFHPIQRLASEYWVSTPALAEKYQTIKVRITPPLPDKYITPSVTNQVVQIFYHGSQSHMDEIRWLRPIIEQVLKTCPQAHFEIIGNHEINKLYRDLPRTRILHPMSWNNYLDHCHNMNGDIGLAPLLESNFNAGRSHTKVMDIARCGSIGIYTDHPVYADAIRNGENGWLLPNDPQAWIVKICSLVSMISTHNP